MSSEPRQSSGAITLQGEIADLGAAGGATGTAYFAAPEAGYIKEILCVRDAAGGAGTSALTLTTAQGAVADTLILVTAGAAGDVDQKELSKFTANNYVEANQGFSIASDGAFAGTPAGSLVVVMEAY